MDQRGDLAAPQMTSGIVTKTDSADVIRALFSCRRAMRLIRAGGVASYVLGGIGAVGSILLAAFSLVGVLPSIAFVGYHLILSLLFVLVSKITV